MIRQTMERVGGPRLAVVGLALAAGGLWAIALAADVTCTGQTGAGTGGCRGTNQADQITGTERRDFVKARGGDDVVLAGGSYDEVAGGDGDDELHGGGQGDWLRGGSGDNDLFGDGGNDFLESGNGDDLLDGGDGDDSLVAEGGDDVLLGGPGDEADGAGSHMFGGDGDDQLFGGDGSDRMSGEGGNDQLFGEGGNDFLRGEFNESADSTGDTIDCGDGVDEVIANENDTLLNCEVVHTVENASVAGAAARERAAQREKARLRAAFLDRRDAGR